jgi:UDPglucose 6-dehydrogenase
LAFVTSSDALEHDQDGSLRVGVLGLWHLGCVTAACLADSGFTVVGVDPDPEVISELRAGRPPIAEPGLSELISEGQRSGRLRFEGTDGPGLAEVECIWIAFDTPVDDDDRADSDWVIDQAHQALRRASPGTKVIVSSQLPVGSTGRLAALLAADGRDDFRFACIPENLRLGQALSSFRSPERVVAGLRDISDRDWLSPLITPFTDHIEWMSIESAEMTKHALNSFLATSVAFINELASLCESVGADAAEVSRGLKSDQRIGPRSYLSPGDVFAGGTLARDVSTLIQLNRAYDLPAHLISGVSASNTAHREWAGRALVTLLGADESARHGEPSLDGKRIAVWGLTYKPGTDTLRRSSALDLCRWLYEQGATVRAHDPAISALPQTDVSIELCATELSAVEGADALVLCTPWPSYREISPREVIATMRTPIVVDAGGHLSATLGADPAIQYARVGTRPT